MKTWLLAVIVTSVVVPSSALMTAARIRAGKALEDQRGALGDVLLDSPVDPHGLIRNVETVATVVGSQEGVQHTSKMLTAPVLLEASGGRSVARLEGLALESPRMDRLESFVTSGQLKALGTSEGGLVIGESLALELGVRATDTVHVLNLAPGPKALGFRRQALKIAALLQSGLGDLNSMVALTDLETARSLSGPGAKVSGVLAWLATPLGVEEIRSSLASVVSDDRRVRHYTERDRPLEDSIALVSTAQTTLFLVFVVTFLSLPLVGLKRGEASYGTVIMKVAPIASLAIATSMLAGVGTAALLEGWDATARHFSTFSTDLVRLLMASVFGVLVSPLLAGRLRNTLAMAALATTITIAMYHATAATVVASAARRTAERLSSASETIERISSSGPVIGAIMRGAEVVPIDLIGLDPNRPESTKLLQELCGGDPPTLRNEGDKRPRPRPPIREGIDDLLNQLAEKGAPEPEGDVADDANPGREDNLGTPKIVLGHNVALRLGAAPGDFVRVAVAPPGLSPESDDDPPWPRTFEVIATATLGLRTVDSRLAIADTWQVEALGGTHMQQGDTSRPSDDVAQRAARPFERHAERSAIVASLQISVITFLLGGLFLSEGRRSWSSLFGWGAIGVIGGALLGFNHATQGLVPIGDPAWYEALPRGQATGTDILAIWAFVPAIVGIIGAALGLYVRMRRSAMEQ